MRRAGLAFRPLPRRHRRPHQPPLRASLLLLPGAVVVVLLLVIMSSAPSRLGVLARAVAAGGDSGSRASRVLSSNPSRLGFLAGSPCISSRGLASSSGGGSTVAVGLGRGRGGGGGGSDGKISKGKKKGDLPEKICVVCGRPFTWRAKWEKVWDEVKYCSDRCRSQRGKAQVGGSADDGAMDGDAADGGGGKWGGGGQRKRSAAAVGGAGGLKAAAAPPSAMLSRRQFSARGAGTMAACLVGGALLGPSSLSVLRPPSPALAAEQARRPAKGEVEAVLEGREEDLWPSAVPPYEREDFRRLDETDDALFYDAPKLVEHIDPPAVAVLTRYHAEALRDLAAALYGDPARRLDVLDLGASWVSHLPPQYDGGAASDAKASRVAGLGMNKEELALNKQLTEFTMQDLNKRPALPYPDDAFDCVLCALTIDYLVRPVSVLAEAVRVLRPGGLLAVTFSNRLFIQKAVALWAGKDDVDHVFDVGTFIHYASLRNQGTRHRLTRPKARDLSPSPTKGDPLYVVYAYKEKQPAGGA